MMFRYNLESKHNFKIGMQFKKLKNWKNSYN